MNKYPDIEITKADLRKIIYFILMKYNGDELHRQGNSSKRDFIGGYIERWMNRIGESIAIDKLLLDKHKPYKVIQDYFIYGNDSEKNAPDILGLQLNSGSVIPFAKYCNGTWKNVPGKPRVEVKAYRKDQNIVSVRNSQMINDYYVFVETQLEPDYLTILFEESVFDTALLEDLQMNYEFIEEDINNQIIPHSVLSKAKRIGFLRLIGIYTKDEFLKYSTFLPIGVEPYYYSLAENVDRIIGNTIVSDLEYDNLGRVVYKNGIDETKYLPFTITTPENTKIKIVKKNKGSMYIWTNKDIQIESSRLMPGNIKINFKKFERTSRWDENGVLKSTIEQFGKDSTIDLINLFDELV